MSNGPVRVLVVDDSVVVRRLVTQALDADPGIEVAGTAANGRIALSRIGQLAPDLVTLDVEMPELDGVETLKALRATHPKLPVVMFSTLTERGARTTLDALAAGASDYVTKPANLGSVQESIEAVRSQLVPRIHALCPRTSAASTRTAAPRTAAAASPARTPATGSDSGPVRLVERRSRPPAPPQVVLIGASTGGPTAVEQVLQALPAPFPVPILVVQHMPPVFTGHLAERLDRVTRLHVREAVDGAVVGPGQAWIAPGGHHLEVRRLGSMHRLVVSDGPPENAVRPAVDVLFRSAATAYGAASLAVVLTGMGIDGQRGAEELVRAGASVVAQDEDSSVVWGMPGAVVRAGLAEAVVPLDQVALTIQHRLRPVARARPGPAAAVS